MRIFVLLSRVPYPLEKGDKLRAFNHIKYLSQKNEIILCALNTSSLHKDALLSLKPFCKSINIINLSRFRILLNLLRALFSSKPFQVEYFFTKNIKKKIYTIINESNPEHIFCQLIRVSEYVKNINIPKTLDYQDVFSKGIERRIKPESFYLKWLLKIEHKRLLKYENQIYQHFNNKIIISASDRSFIPHVNKNSIHVIPNGVDTDFFQPLKADKEFSLVFTGNMGYYPNIMTALYLANTILPGIHKYNGNVNLLIAGANPHKKIRALCSENIFVSGWVNDIRDSYMKSRIFIAPMLIGTGMQNKILEAMAMKLPCITSNLANSAIQAQNGKEIIVCAKPDEYINSVLELINDNLRYDTIASNGYDFVRSNYNWNRIVSRLNDIMKNATP